MKEIHIDIGNTRAKFRVVNQQREICRGVCEVDELLRLVDSQQIKRALVASVTAESVRQQLEHDFAEAGVIETFWAETGKQFGDVVNAYEDYQRLGVDRWLAVIAAFSRFRKACCIFDFGSAVTVDFVNNDGRHQGGYIVPGSGLCFNALSQNTAALNPALVMSESVSPGDSTEICIQNGIYLQQAGFARSVMDLLNGEFIVCTGGGFAQVASAFKDKDHLFIADLILDGLQIVANERPV